MGVDVAIDYCDKAIASKEFSGRTLAGIYYNRAVAWQRKNAGDRQLADLNEAIRLDPQLAVAFLARAKLKSSRRDDDAALADLNEAIRVNPRLAEAFLHRGQVWLRKREPDRAIADLNEALRLEPVDVTRYAGAGSAYSGRPRNFDRSQHDGDVLSVRGIAYLNKKAYDEAIADFTEAIRLDGTNSVAFLNRGYAWGEKQDYDKAIADYSEAIRLDPRNPRNYYNRGEVYRRAKKYERALADFDQIIRANPKASYAYRARGVVWADRLDFERAISDYSRAIELDPRDRVSIASRGLARMLTQDHERAVADYTAAVLLNPLDPAIVKMRGIAFFYRGDYTAAASDLEAALRLNETEGFSVLWLYLARMRGAKSDPAQARTELEGHAARLKPDAWPYPIVELYLGKSTAEQLLASTGKTEKLRGDQTCEASFFIGERHLAQGDVARALPALQAAKESCPRNYFEYAGAVAELTRQSR